MLKSKIHRATVTDANVDYEGSISIDTALMDQAGLREYEEVQVWDVTNGARLATYVIPAPAGSGEICLNGAAAKLINKGDKVIIASYVYCDEQSINHKAVRVFVDEKNQTKTIERD